jgi:hypothetical protein
VCGSRPLIWTSALYQKGSLTSAIGNDFISTLHTRSPIDMVVRNDAAGEGKGPLRAKFAATSVRTVAGLLSTGVARRSSLKVTKACQPGTDVTFPREHIFQDRSWYRRDDLPR